MPTTFRRKVFNQLHGLSHPGVRATKKLIRERFIWPSINKDCASWVKLCKPCQTSKVTKHISSPYGSFPVSSRRFADVHIDVVGPLSPSEGYSYLLTCVDRYSRWPEAFPISDITSETICRTFFDGWVSRFGSPENIVSDRGRQFTSKLFQDLAKFIGSQSRQTTSYHAQANGMVERFHRTLKAALMCHEDQQWTKTLPKVLLGIRTSLKEDLKATAAEMIYGESLHLPGDFFHESELRLDPTDFISQLKRSLSELRPIPASNHSKQKIFIHKELQNCSHVWIRCDAVKKPLQPKFNGPYLVIERKAKYYKLRINNKEDTVSIDRLKPAFFEETTVSPSIITTKASNSILKNKQSSACPKTTRSGRIIKPVSFSLERG